MWFTAAVAGDVVEPHAMTLSTIGSDGVPDARVPILKDVTPGCWWFASNSESAKGVQLTQRPVAALTFYWPIQARSIRIRGVVRPAPAAKSAADLRARGSGARAVACETTLVVAAQW